jgi:hypothetical protein
MVRTVRVLALALVLSLPLHTVSAHAVHVDRDVKTVMTGAAYGLAIGTVLGLITLPLTGSVRTMFLGSSVGMYLGAAVGGYHAMNRDDPQNPLNPQNAQNSWIDRSKPKQVVVYAELPVIRF